LVHIINRGGGELGKLWYHQGKVLQKKNTFADFIACAHFVRNKKLSNPSIMTAYAASAGGLLLGAVLLFTF
jgi:oligopeptidase B